MGTSALGLEARVIGADEGADVVGHVEQLGPLLVVEGHREAAEAVDRHAALFADLERHPRLAVRLSCAFSARKRSSSAVTSSSDMRQG